MRVKFSWWVSGYLFIELIIMISLVLTHESTKRFSASPLVWAAVLVVAVWAAGTIHGTWRGWLR